MHSLKRKTLLNCLLTKWWHILNCHSLDDQTRETETDSPMREMKDIMASWSVTLQSQVKVATMTILCVYIYVCVFSCIWLQSYGLWPARLFCSRNFPGKNTGVPFPTPRDLPDPGIKPVYLASPPLAARFFTNAPTRKPYNDH